MDSNIIGIASALPMFLEYFAGSHNQREKELFCEGDFKIKERVHPRVVGRIVSTMRNMSIKYANNRNLVGALSRVAYLPNFDVGRFLHKLSAHPYMMEKKRTVDDYLDVIEGVYNRQARKDTRMDVAREARELLESRKVIKSAI